MFSLLDYGMLLGQSGPPTSKRYIKSHVYANPFLWAWEPALVWVAFVPSWEVGKNTKVLRILLIRVVSVLKACNWAVGTFCFGSFFMHEFCLRKRKLERQQMQRVVEIVEQKKAEKAEKKTQAEAAHKTTAPRG